MCAPPLTDMTEGLFRAAMNYQIKTCKTIQGRVCFGRLCRQLGKWLLSYAAPKSWRMRLPAPRRGCQQWNGAPWRRQSPTSSRCQCLVRQPAGNWLDHHARARTSGYQLAFAVQRRWSATGEGFARLAAYQPAGARTATQRRLDGVSRAAPKTCYEKGKQR